MTKVLFLTSFGNNDAGEVIDLDAEYVRLLLKESVCELCKGEKLPPQPSAKPKPAPKKK